MNMLAVAPVQYSGILALILVAHAGSVSGIRCLECVDSPHPHSCDVITECPGNDLCNVQQFITSGGLILFNTGCMSKQRCSATKRNTFDMAVNNRTRRVGDIITCSECCDGEYCNIEGCGDIAKKQPARGPLCYQCTAQSGLKACRDVTECDFGEQCYLTELFSDVKRWKTGCSRHCDLVATVAHNVSACSMCCQEDFCNDHCQQLPISVQVTNAQTSPVTTNVVIATGLTTSLTTNTSSTVTDATKTDAITIKPTTARTPTTIFTTTELSTAIPPIATTEVTTTNKQITTTEGTTTNTPIATTEATTTNKPTTTTEATITNKPITTTEATTTNKPITTTEATPTSKPEISTEATTTTKQTTPTKATTTKPTTTTQATTTKPIPTTKATTTNNPTTTRQTSHTVLAMTSVGSTTKTPISVSTDKSTFVQTIPTTIKPASSTWPTAPPSACPLKPVDIIFVLDGSGSVGTENFQRQLAFVSNFTSQFEIGPNKTRVAVVTYGTHVTDHFFLDSFLTKSTLMSHIGSIHYPDGETSTHLALQFVENTILSPANDNRNVTKIVIVLTDGRSTEPVSTAMNAIALKNNSMVEVTAIGIGKDVDPAELRTIASDANHTFQVPTYDVLSTLQAELTDTACNTCKNDHSDICFVLDSSGSEGIYNFKKQLEFVNLVINEFTVDGSRATRFCVITFSNDAHTDIHLNTYTTKQGLLNNVPNIQYRDGETRTDLGLHRAHAELRHSNSKVVIVLTDGRSLQPHGTIHQANQLHKDGAEMISIGIGRSIDMDEISAMASGPDHVFMVHTFGELDSIHQHVVDEICNKKYHASPPVTAPMLVG